MWWFYMTWFPKFLYDHHQLDLKHIGLPLVIVYLMADIGSVAGGGLSSFMLHRGWSVNRRRKTALLIPALAILPVMFAQEVSGLWSAVLLLGLATASHQAFSSNLYTLVSDTFPRRGRLGRGDWWDLRVSGGDDFPGDRRIRRGQTSELHDSVHLFGWLTWWRLRAFNC